MKEEFITLATRVITGEATIKEKEELDEQVQASPALRQLYEELNVSWNEAAKLDQESFTEADWQKLNLRIENHQPAGRKNNLYRWGIAASVVLVAAVSFFLLRSGGNETFYAETADMEVVLEDNSIITLKKGSTVHFASDFKNHREVELEGEAFFKVAKDPQHPFSVKTGETVTTVLGTEFLLKQNTDSRSVQLKVREGKVRFENKQAGQQVLVAGEAAEFKAGAISRTEAPDANDFSLVTKQLQFIDAPVSEVLTEVAAFYNLTIDTSALAPNVSTFNGRFKDHTPEQVAQRIMEVTGVTITISGNKWVIKGGKQ